MQMKNEACSFCSCGADYGPVEGIGVCDQCARLIATIAGEGDREIWSGTEPDAAAGASAGSLEESLARFKQGVAGLIPNEDADSHANLAEAYRAMGLHDEAVGEAATALRSGRQVPVITSALQMLLSPPLLRPDGFVRLRGRVRTTS